MKKIILIFFIALTTFAVKAQTCDEIMEYVKKEGGYGTTYTSYNSDAISKVTFYQVSVDYKTLNFCNCMFQERIFLHLFRVYLSSWLKY
jgi:hypothetical protein